MSLRSIALLSILIFCTGLAVFAEVPDVANATLEGRCVRVVDGDTIQIIGGETIRLLGIDTPETGYPFASDAKWFTHGLIARCDIRIEPGTPSRDAYNRLLAHVYVETEEGWINVNAELVRAGLADLLFIPPNMRYYSHFQALLEEAQIERRGMWGAIPGALSIEELECDLVDCVTEVITVAFTVSSVEEHRRGILLSAEASEYGFHILILEDSDAALALVPYESFIGQTVSVTGVLECNVRYGPWIEVTSPAQIRIETEEDNASQDTP